MREQGWVGCKNPVSLVKEREHVSENQFLNGRISEEFRERKKERDAYMKQKVECKAKKQELFKTAITHEKAEDFPSFRSLVFGPLKGHFRYRGLIEPDQSIGQFAPYLRDSGHGWSRQRFLI